MSRLVVASPHRYADLARLWQRVVHDELVPAFSAAGIEVEVVLFRDAHAGAFDPRHFTGTLLERPRPAARDFIEFYERALELPGDYLLLLDADLFLLDGAWAASQLDRFEDPRVAAVSLLRRTEQPGVYALLCRSADYRALAPPVFAPSYERIEDWPRAINRQPGDRAAMALRAAGRRIVEIEPTEAAGRLADFHGTTVLRAAREVFGAALGRRRFARLLAERRYFAMGAYDNLLLGTLYRALYGEPFAPGPDGEELAASATRDELREALARIDDRRLVERLSAYFERSDAAIARLADHLGMTLDLPRGGPRPGAGSGRGAGRHEQPAGHRLHRHHLPRSGAALARLRGARLPPGRGADRDLPGLRRQPARRGAAAGGGAAAARSAPARVPRGLQRRFGAL